MSVAGDHTWLFRAISAQKPTFWSPRSGPTTRLPEGALEAVTWLAGGGGAAVRHQESWSSWFGLGSRRRVGGGGWGLAGSSGEVLSAVLINYLPATGLLAALGCLLANAVSHALSGMWSRGGTHRPPSENDASSWHPRHLKSSCLSRSPHMQALLHTTHAGYSYTLLTALPSQSLALGGEGGTDPARGF